MSRSFRSFVVYDRSHCDGYYRRGEEKLSGLTRAIERMERDPEWERRADLLAAAEDSCGERWSAAKANERRAKGERRAERERLRPALDEGAYEALDERLKQEGAAIQRERKRRRVRIRRETAEARDAVEEVEPKDARRQISRELLDRLFDRYAFLDSLGVEQSLPPRPTPDPRPPRPTPDPRPPRPPPDTRPPRSPPILDSLARRPILVSLACRPILVRLARRIAIVKVLLPRINPNGKLKDFNSMKACVKWLGELAGRRTTWVDEMKQLEEEIDVSMFGANPERLF